MRATMRIKFSDSAYWGGGKSALIGNVSTHLKQAKGMSLRFDEIACQTHPLHALQSYKKNQNCFYHTEIVCRRQKKV